MSTIAIQPQKEMLPQETATPASLSVDQIELVQQTFALVEPIAGQAAALFYNRLFELDPTLRPMFKSDLSEQQRKLMQTLQVAVKGLNDLNALVPVLEKLAIRHIAYGVKDEHYATVGSALLWTLERGLGDSWTNDVREAWTSLYGVLSNVMMNATTAQH